jgi:ATP-dependent Clp protease ATP-binding subunit ClpC
MVDSNDLSTVIAEAADIAKSVGQRMTTAHVLLSLFTVENKAALLLKERHVDEDRLLELMTHSPSEPEGLVRAMQEKTREIAASCGSQEADCLHLLIAITRVRCGAQDLLFKTGIDLTALRNVGLSYFTSGLMPRRFISQQALGTSQARPVGAPPVMRTATVMPPRPAIAPVSLKDLIDDAPHSPPVTETINPLPARRPAVATSGAPSFKLDASQFPLLTSLGKNLTARAREGALDPVVGRAKEIDEVIDILGKRRTNNPCLVGEPGVGKTAVVEGVADLLAQMKGPLGERVVVELDMATLVAGTQLRGSFSERLNALKDEVRLANGKVIVFIDEIHTLIGAGATGDGPQDAANELKAAMSRGEFPCIGATTFAEYRKHVESDPALERRFTAVVVNEPSVADTVYILNGVKGRYETHHQLVYTPEALQAAASLSAKYISDRFLPDKAISTLDLAGSRVRREGRSTVEPSDIARVVAKVAKLPEERLLLDDSQRLLRLEADLKQRIIGHEDVVAQVAQVIRRNYAGFSSKRPMGSFLFLGPTGVGKTETARVLADVLFGSKDALIRLDMSEMSEGHGVSRLIGAPAGYVGYGDGGQLTEAVRKRPSSVVVFDEIDKASRESLLLLLQVLDEGRLSDGKGRSVDFSNTVVVLTTNFGAEAFGKKSLSMGFGSAQNSDTQNSAAIDAAKKCLPPELWNRIDERCVFHPLQERDVMQIASLLLTQSSERLRQEKGISFQAEDEVVRFLLNHGGFVPELGARPMRQTVQRLIEGPLAEHILKGDFVKGEVVQVSLRRGEERLFFQHGG